MTDDNKLFDDYARYVRIPISLLVPLLALLIWVISLNTSVQALKKTDTEIENVIYELDKQFQEDHDILIEIYANTRYIRQRLDELEGERAQREEQKN